MQLDPSMLEWVRESLERRGSLGGELESDVADMAHLLMVLGWIERRLFAQQLSLIGLTIPQFFTLVAIHHHEGGSTMGNLAEETRQCSATMTGIIDRLLKTGLVQRLRDDKDRRLVLVSLTDAGRQILREALDERLSRLQGAMEHLEHTQRREIIDALRTYVHHSKATLSEEATHLPC